MMRFKNRQHTPPSGFRFKHPTTGMEISARQYDQWHDKIQEHCEGNNLPPVDPLDAEHQNCGRLPKTAAQMFCVSDGDPNDVAYEALRLTAFDVARGTATIASFKLSGVPLVPQEEAERRAAICATCPCNTPFRMPCGGLCGELKTIVEEVVGSQKTSKDEQLFQCSVCRCFLGAKVFLPLDALKKWESESLHEKYPASWCWMRENEEIPEKTLQ